MGIGLLIIGSMLASGATTEKYHNTASAAGLTAGVSLALLAALGVALYQVVFRHIFGRWKHEPRFLAFFGAWVSLWHLVVIFPLLYVASVVGLESMDFPHGYHTVMGTGISAAIASSVNTMYLCIALWGSVMLLPCVSALSVPMTVFLDVVLHDVRPSRIEFLGDMLIVVGVVLVMDLAVYFISARPPVFGKMLPSDSTPSTAPSSGEFEA
eukprot:SRR837773.16952.p1 GENE.SRR837773.16952~~SRR837773.16952.p1  ORF type:complete len:211 (+),score=79.77 SRR837773.16952:461-1093(+)